MKKQGINPVSPEAYFPGRLKEKVLFITGAAKGSIGGATAIRAAREGAKVFCVDIKEKELQETCDQISADGGVAFAHLADVRDPHQVDLAEKNVSHTSAK